MARSLPTGALRKIYNANVFSLLLIFKFAFLIAYTWVVPHERDLFGEYTLAIGLTNSFFILAGMRARFYVMQALETMSELFQLCFAMAVMGVLATLAVYWLNRGSDIFLLIMLVGMAKFLEMFLDAGTAFLQQRFGRETAFNLLNQHGYMVVASFVVLVFFSLEWAVLAEVAILAFTVIRQWIVLRQGIEQPLRLIPGELFAVLRGGMAYTGAAALNSAQLTGFLYLAQASFSQPTVLLISKIFAAQAIFSRLITGNNFYFKAALDRAIRSLARHTLVFSLIALMVLAGTFAATIYWPVPQQIALLGLGAIFTVINVANVVIRQHVMIVAGVGKLIVLHAVELIIILVPLALLPLLSTTALALLATVRLWRVNTLKRIALATAPESASPGENPMGSER